MLQTGVREDVTTEGWRLLCVADKGKRGRHHSIVEVLCAADRVRVDVTIQ